MKKSSLITLFILATIFTQATHRMGGNIGWTCLGNNQYELYTYSYVDCIEPALQSSIIITGKSSCDTLYFTLNMVDLSPGNPSTMGVLDTTNLCSSSCSNNGAGIMIFKFSNIVNIASCSDWEFCDSYCCRNISSGYSSSSLTGTFTNSGMQAGEIATMNNASGNCDDSPLWNTSPRFFLCQGVEMTLDNSATDADGDSLVFELVDARSGCDSTITYFSPFSGTYPLSTVSGSFPINSTSGISTITPLFTSGFFQLSTISVKISEYRNGVLIGSIMRDNRVETVQNCDPLNTTFMGITDLGSQTTLVHDTLQVYAGDSLDFSLVISDTIYRNPFTISNTLSYQIPSIQFLTDTLLNNYTLTGNTQLLTQNSHIGTYHFNIVAENDSCPFRFADIYPFVLEILPQPNSIKKERERNFHIYPNPSNGKFKVELPTEDNEVKMTITDITGKIYFSKMLTKTTELDLDIPKGIYIFHLSSKNGVISEKVIIE